MDPSSSFIQSAASATPVRVVPIDCILPDTGFNGCNRKLLYGLWLCSGVFIMIATLLRCILCLQSADNINLGTIWSIRETVIHLNPSLTQKTTGGTSD